MNNLNVHARLFLVLLIFSLVPFETPQARAQSDESIKLAVETEIANTHNLRGAQVRVIVEDGFVILLGAVYLYFQKMQIEEIAWHITGVLEVDNEIDVIPQIFSSDQVIKENIWIDSWCSFYDMWI